MREIRLAYLLVILLGLRTVLLKSTGQRMEERQLESHIRYDRTVNRKKGQLEYETRTQELTSPL